MEKFEFGLQLFAEDSDGTTAEDSIAEESPQSLDQLTRVALDDDGNVRLLPGDAGKQEPAAKRTEKAALQADEDETEESNPDSEAEPKTPAGEQQRLYDQDELRTMDFDKIDPKRLPPEMQAWYRSMQAPITRKNQELSDQRKQYNELIEQVKQVKEAQPKPPQQPPLSQAEFYGQVHNFARNEVAKRFNLDPARLPQNTSEWPDALKLAYNDVNNGIRLAAVAKQRQAQQEQRQQQMFRDNADAVEAELRTTDAEAYEYVENRLKNGELSVKDIRALGEALTKGDKDFIKKQFDAYRAEYRAQKNNIQTGERSSGKKAPPRVENSGPGLSPEGRKLPNYTELGDLKSFDDRLAWLRRNGITP